MNKQIAHYENKLKYEIDAWDLSEELKSESKLIVIDARSKEAFDQEHIPGATNIPHRIMNEQATKHLNKDTLYITYCDGIGCNASTKAALKMTHLGFCVKELLGGLDWWKRDGHKTEGSNITAKHDGICGC